jgi:hypothetical protein
VSLHEWRVAQTVRRAPFYALIMAALLNADSDNAERLRECWPVVCDEAQRRYDAPGGLFEGEPGYDEIQAIRREWETP